MINIMLTSDEIYALILDELYVNSFCFRFI